ncbi:hypothetical protein SEMRO_2897_G339680.1 [Seminavis robusta]|uniref:Uncharacterized protein n=1 Tax=Seminavis robusta TaxID=568900 RepID=A0A9N8F2T5_9STRA|nr:hypothetical protein SEMRO_2897_G339680.1 [Seminavis robusta]|eukprot:Sro2897_g339680.1 n/a (515) ;mRNA; r:1747-3386
MQSLLQRGGMAAVELAPGGLGEVVIRHHRKIFGSMCVGTREKRHQPHVSGNRPVGDYVNNSMILERACQQSSTTSISIDQGLTSSTRRRESSAPAELISKTVVGVGPLTCVAPIHILSFFGLLPPHHLGHAISNPRKNSKEMEAYLQMKGMGDTETKDTRAKNDRILNSTVKFIRARSNDNEKSSFDQSVVENMDCASSRDRAPRDHYFPTQPILKRMSLEDGNVEMMHFRPMLRRPLLKQSLKKGSRQARTRFIWSSTIDVDEYQTRRAEAVVNRYGLHEKGDCLEMFSGSMLTNNHTPSREQLMRKLVLVKDGALDKGGRFLTVCIPMERVNGVPGLEAHLRVLCGVDPTTKNDHADVIKRHQRCKPFMQLVIREAEHVSSGVGPFNNLYGPGFESLAHQHATPNAQQPQARRQNGVAKPQQHSQQGDSSPLPLPPLPQQPPLSHQPAPPLPRPNTTQSLHTEPECKKQPRSGNEECRDLKVPALTKSVNIVDCCSDNPPFDSGFPVRSIPV